MPFTKTLLARPSESGSVARPTIKVIGAKANRYLSAPGFSGQVIAAGTRSAYIATDDGNILAACRLDQHPHPRSFLTDLDLATIQVGLRAWVEGTELRFGNGISLDLRDCQVWDRQLPVASSAAPWQLLRSRCDELFSAARDLHVGENLGLAIPFFTTDSDTARGVILPKSTPPLVVAGVAGIKRLLPDCRHGKLEPVLNLAEYLIGLGPGLTPSGDDFVGGLVFMSRHLNSAYPDTGLWQGGDIGGLLAFSESMTTPISHALLTDLTEGQSHAALHDLADALFSGTEGFDATGHVRRVMQIGQSSGWDMLTGMLAGLLPVIHRL